MKIIDLRWHCGWWGGQCGGIGQGRGEFKGSEGVILEAGQLQPGRRPCSGLQDYSVLSSTESDLDFEIQQSLYINWYFGDICNYSIYASQFRLIMKISPINPLIM